MSSAKFPGKIACIGEAMVELMLGNDRHATADIGFAGDSLNTAIYLKRLLGESADVSYITVLGNDPLSSRMMDFIGSESISTEYIKRSSTRAIGLYAIETDEDGERTFSYWRSQSAARTLFQSNDSLDFSMLASFSVICFSAISLAILPAEVRGAFLQELARLRRENGTVIVFDSNYRPALWENQAQAQNDVADAWRVADIALPSIDDEQALFEDNDEQALLARLKSYGINSGALKRGSRGPVSLGQSQDSLDPSILKAAEKLTIVDTTAAGDSFNAGYLSASLSGSDEQTALVAGHECAMRVISHSGAIIPLEDW